MTPLVLLLGGTTEASGLAALLASEARLRTLLSLAGVTRAPGPSPVPRRIGGFGGASGLARFVRDAHVAAIVDATHPFATRMSANAREAAARTGVPLLRLTRAPWIAGAGDRWTMVDTAAEAAARLGPAPRRVLLTIGRIELAPFAALAHRFVVRSVDPPDPAMLPRDAHAIAARFPFSLEDELALFRRERIELLVTKNSGGDATRAKLDAARIVGADVLMIRRPRMTDEGPVATDPAAAFGFLAHACLGA